MKETVEYPIVKFALALRLKRSRFVGDSLVLRDVPGIAGTVARWVQRQRNRKWPDAVFGEPHMRLDENIFFTEGLPALVVWLRAVRNVPEQHRLGVAAYIDAGGSHISVPVLTKPDWLPNG